jgi:hypothetical protein
VSFEMKKFVDSRFMDTDFLVLNFGQEMTITSMTCKALADYCRE